MIFTRRSFLQTTGAVGLLAASPLSIAAGSQSAGLATAATSDDLWAVVSPSRAWSICENAHYAYHEASMIRHSGAVCSTHMRCTPAFAQQVQVGNLTNFVEIDRGPSHQMKQKNRTILGAGERAEVVASLDEGNVEDSLAWFRCSKVLSATPQDWLGTSAPEPEIVRITSYHMLPSEYYDHLHENIGFRTVFAYADRIEKKLNAKSNGYVAYEPQTRWLWGAGRGRKCPCLLWRTGDHES